MEDAAAIIKEFALSESGRLSAPAVAGSALPALAVFAVALCVAVPSLAWAADPGQCGNCWFLDVGQKVNDFCYVNEGKCPQTPHYYAPYVSWHGQGSGCWGPYDACHYHACVKCEDYP